MTPDSVLETGQLASALDRLVQRGVLTPEQAAAVTQEYHGSAAPPGLRRLLGEIAGYLGASFVVGAALLFLGQQWELLGAGGRIAVLAGMAVVLGGAGAALRRRHADSARRRLASTLLTGAAAAAGSAVFVAVDLRLPDDRSMLAGSAAGLAVAAGGYLLARSALGQVAVAVAAYLTYASALLVVEQDNGAVLGAGLVALGLGWVLLVRARLVAERRFALAIAVTSGLAGAQLVVFGDTGQLKFLGYAVTALIAGACFTAYARIREWIVLAGGVVGATVVVPQFLYEVGGGSLGASGVMLAAGVTLLGGSLAGLRIRRNPQESPATGATTVDALS